MIGGEPGLGDPEVGRFGAIFWGLWANGRQEGALEAFEKLPTALLVRICGSGPGLRVLKQGPAGSASDNED